MGEVLTNAVSILEYFLDWRVNRGGLGIVVKIVENSRGEFHSGTQDRTTRRERSFGILAQAREWLDAPGLKGELKGINRFRRAIRSQLGRYFFPRSSFTWQLTVGNVDLARRGDSQSSMSLLDGEVRNAVAKEVFAVVYSDRFWVHQKMILFAGLILVPPRRKMHEVMADGDRCRVSVLRGMRDSIFHCGRISAS